jgi:hypothetical protein
MGDLLRPSAIEKASFNETERQEMQQSVENHMMHYNSHEDWVSKPSVLFLNISPSHLLTFSPSTLHFLISPGKKLLIKMEQ